MAIAREAPRTWTDIISVTGAPNFWSVFETLLTAIGLTVEDADRAFELDYEEAITTYANSSIEKVFNSVYLTNLKKYQKMIAVYAEDYDALEDLYYNETYTDLRTPNLQSATTSTGSASGTVKNNQTRTTTETPNGWQTQNIHSVNPYDNSGMRSESQDISTESGTRSSAESWSGTADQTSSTSSGSQTTTETGTETITHTATKHGNNGGHTLQELAEQEFTLAARMNIFKIIEKDLAAKVFLQVWL